MREEHIKESLSSKMYRLTNYKNIGFLSNTGPGSLKNHKATETAFIVGPSSARQQNTI